MPIMAISDIFRQEELLNLPQLRRGRPDWSDRLPHLYEHPGLAGMPYVKWHWSFLIPRAAHDRYSLWLAKRRYRRNIERIEIDELEEVADTALNDDRAETLGPIYEKHAARRKAARFLVATRERRVLERLASRWDLDASRMIVRGEADEAAIAQVRRAVREARWTLAERLAKVLIPVLSLTVAMLALLLTFMRP